MVRIQYIIKLGEGYYCGAYRDLDYKDRATRFNSIEEVEKELNNNNYYEDDHYDKPISIEIIGEVES